MWEVALKGWTFNKLQLEENQKSKWFFPSSNNYLNLWWNLSGSRYLKYQKAWSRRLVDYSLYLIKYLLGRTQKQLNWKQFKGTPSLFPTDLRRDRVPLGRGEVVRSSSDLSVELLLILVPERRVANQEDVQDDS